MNLTHKLLTRALKPVLWGLFFAVAGGPVSVSAVVPIDPVDTNTQFELDGNAVRDAASPPPIDWADVYTNSIAGGGPGVVGQSFINDPLQGVAALGGPGDDFFTGGGSKDVLGIGQWKSKTANAGIQDKDDILHAYAAEFPSNPDGQELIYFGADRYDNSGDANIGFWFFKTPVSVDKATGKFIGHHVDGDVLVLSNFTVGGSTSLIAVYKWSGDDATGSLVLVNSQTGSGTPGTPFCLSDHSACGVSNSVPIASPWPTYFKGTGQTNTFQKNIFYEGGINITALLGGSECFASFLAETRSSQSPTATLSDYALGPFKSCSIDISKTCAVTGLAPSNSGFKFTGSYSATVTNTGQGSLPVGTQINVVDQASSSTTPSDTQSTTLAAALPPGGTVQFSGTFLTNDDPPSNTITADALFSGNDLQASYGPVQCTQLVVDELVSITKQCGIPANWVTPNTPARPGVELVLVNSLLVTRVNVSGTISTATPAGATGVPLSITVFDLYPGVSPPGQQLTSNVPAVLAPDSSGNYSYSYYPSAADAPVPSAANVVSFTDTVNVAGNNSTYGVSHVSSAGPLTCKVCPCTGVGCP